MITALFVLMYLVGIAGCLLFIAGAEPLYIFPTCIAACVVALVGFVFWIPD